MYVQFPCASSYSCDIINRYILNNDKLLLYTKYNIDKRYAKLLQLIWSLHAMIFF